MRFPDGSVSTFRPSALRLTSQPEEEMSQVSPYRALPVSKPKAVNKAPVVPVETDFKPGKPVRIITGRLSGQFATVIRAVNGWVQLETSHGEIAKRSSELEFLEDNTVVQFSSGHHHYESLMKPGRPSRSIKPNRFYQEDSEAELRTSGRESRSSSIDSTDPKSYDEDFEIPDTWKSLDLPLLSQDAVRAKRGNQHEKYFASFSTQKLIVFKMHIKQNIFKSMSIGRPRNSKLALT